METKPTEIRSLLETTENTRELGGLRTAQGRKTRCHSLLRSDIQSQPSKRDVERLREMGITTVIDLRSVPEVESLPSGFAGREGFAYWSFPIVEGSRIPACMEDVPPTYLQIAQSASMTEVFRHIAGAPGGVMFNCSAGKDRTGVVSAILLAFAGVSDEDIIANYVLTRDYARLRLEMVHKRLPELDMRIVTPCDWFMREFLRLFRERYPDVESYFRAIGLTEEEMEAIRAKLL